jgi:hypothetical protein
MTAGKPPRWSEVFTARRMQAGCEDVATAARHDALDDLHAVARSLSADSYPELSRYLSRHLD